MAFRPRTDPADHLERKPLFHGKHNVMPLDPEVIKSVEDAVKKHHQPAAVSKRLLAWLNAMSGSAISREKEMDLFTALASAIDTTTEDV